MARRTSEVVIPGGLLDSTSASDRAIEQIRQAVDGIRFGEVRIIIQDGVVVQIERVEKKRLR